MTQEEPSVGERRRRREAERAAQEAGGSQDRPLTRRELRAREAALATGALELDSTGEIRVIRTDEPSPVPDEPPPVTGSIGLTRRELRALRAEQDSTGASTPSRGVPTSASSPAAGDPPTASAPSAAGATEEPATSDVLPSAPSAPGAAEEPATSGVLPTAPPAPPLRRPVVRPPSTAAVRGLSEDGTGLGPTVRGEPASPGATGPTSWSTAEVAAIDVTQTDEPVPDGGTPAAEPDEATRTASSTPVPSIDEVIAGEGSEPEPFAGRPSWAELPPPTPSGAIPAISAPEAAAAQETEVMPAAPADGEEPSTAVEPDDADEDDDHDDADHGTPRWLTALFFLVLAVIGVVLGLLLYRLWRGDDVLTGAAIVMTWTGLLT